MRIEGGEPPLSDALAGDDRSGQEGAARLPARINRYSQAKDRAGSIVEYLDGLDHGSAQRVHDKLKDCGEWLLFHHYYTVDKVRLHAANFCRQHLLCPLCAIRRGSRMLNAYLKRYQVLADRSPELRLHLVTVTVKNGDDLKERYLALKGAWKKLCHWRHCKTVEGALDGTQGAVWSYEVTNEGNGWHPHIHAIVLASETPSWRLLRDQWHQITGDSFIVDTRPIEGDPAEGFMEVCKYAVKFADLKVEDNWKAYLVLRGRRLIGSFGSFRGIEIPEELADEALDDLPYIELFYRYLIGKGYSYLERVPAYDGKISSMVDVDPDTGEVLKRGEGYK